MVTRALRALAGAGDGVLFFVTGAVVIGAAVGGGLGIGTLLRQLDGPDEAPAPATWATCATGGGLATWAMPVPNGVLVRTADDRGAAMALVPAEGREAARFLDAMGCWSGDHGDGAPRAAQ